MFKRSGVVTPMNVLKKITAEDLPNNKMKKTAKEIEEEQTKTTKDK